MRKLTFEMSADVIPFSSAPGAVAKGSYTEVIVSEGSALQPFQLLPVLAHCNAHQRWLLWLSPDQAMNKQWLISAGLKDCPVIHMATRYATQRELVIKALNSAKSHIILEWEGELEVEERKALRQLAEQHGTHLFLIRREGL